MDESRETGLSHGLLTERESANDRQRLCGFSALSISLLNVMTVE